MARSTANVLALLEILQRGGTFTAADLADRLEVDERTVRRYVEHLLELEVPVWSERGRYGGYRLAPGYRMPPLMLTEDEALAVVLGLTLTEREGLMRHASVATETATAKVRRVLPETLGRRLDDLLATLDSTHEAFGAMPPDAVPPETAVLLAVAAAARHRRPIEFDHVARSGGAARRVLQPYGVVAHRRRWYAIGFEPDAGARRSVRLDRIRDVVVRDGTFDVPTDFRPADALIEGFAEASYRHEVVVLVRGPVELVRARLPRSIATVDDVDGAATPTARVRIHAERLEWVPALLASLDLPFVIKRPEELKSLVRDFARRLLADVEAAQITE